MTSYYHTENYITYHRWISYYKQLDLIRSIRPSSILELGPGNGILTNTLRAMNYTVKTMDADPEVASDYHGDIRSLSSIVAPKSFDCIAAFQILEHIPWSDIPNTLLEIQKASRQYAVISVPYSGLLAMLSLKMGRRGIQEWNWGYRIPGFWRSGRFYRRKGHFWECGVRGFSLSKVRKQLQDVFYIESEEYHPYDKSQVFWVLKIKQ